MNQSQLKYARTRAEDIYRKRSQDLKEKFTTKAVSLSVDEKLDAIARGDYLVDVSSIKNGYYWYNAISFPAERLQSIDTKALKPKQDALDAAYRKLEDELVLGDNEKALELLKAFEAA